MVGKSLLTIHSHKSIWIVILALSLLAGCDAADNSDLIARQGMMLVYKSPTCGCCAKWVDHMEQAGFAIDVEDRQDLSVIKSQLNISSNMQSCHTAVSGGYFFEGHVPADEVKRFLTEKPADAAGLSVPGMPIGSPGMEMDGRHDAYQVMLVTKQGEERIYSQH
jgi:hypothetical protein